MLDWRLLDWWRPKTLYGIDMIGKIRCSKVAAYCVKTQTDGTWKGVEMIKDTRSTCGAFMVVNDVDLLFGRALALLIETDQAKECLVE
jgi:hypothetical protein